MNAEDTNVIRLKLTEGHWQLGEHDDALSCLERVDDSAQVRGLLERLLAEETSPEGAQKLRSALDDLTDDQASVPATPTMATLYEKQGLEAKALEIAEHALRANPDDVRAQAVIERLRGGGSDSRDQVVTLERWLDYFEGRRQGEARV